MSKHNFFIRFFKKINLSLNNLLKKYLNKLNLENLANITKSNKVPLTFVAVTILFLSYLSIPNVYKHEKINKELNTQLLNKFDLNFQFSHNLNYNFLPRPHFTYKNVSIIDNQKKISKIKKLKIYVSLKTLFSLENLKVNGVILENANFNLNNKNYNFFSKLLNGNFKDGSFQIKKSNIFYRNIDNEVLFINKIKSLKYFYDIKESRNIVSSKNEIFNLPYSLKVHNNKVNKIIFSTLNLNFLNWKIENKIDYSNDEKKGSSNLILNNKKSKSLFLINNNSMTLSFFDNLEFPEFLYKAQFNFNPFYSTLEGKTEEIDLSSLFNSNALASQLLKTEILNNDKLNFNLSVTANKIFKYQNFTNVFLNSKIKEGLIDFDNTKFSWKNYAQFKILDSLIFVKDNELILDGKLDILIKDSGEIYKSLLTPKNYRTNIKKIELNFNYNFDQKMLNLEDIKINNKINQNVNDNFKTLIFKDDNLQNKIYFKNAINKAIKFYAG